MNGLTLGSLFDGSGGFPLAGIFSGIRPVWASEIEPFAIRVTTKRLPFIKHYGDISSMNGADIEPVDIITFGSPCQDLSVAGKRAGIHDGARSSLFFQAVRVIKEMRRSTNGKYPKYIVWENVPGALSSGNPKGSDFRAVLENICGIADETVSVPFPPKWTGAGEIVGDGFSVAWRILDAQYWGVPQRRKRIFLVADLTGPGAGRILFESEGVSGYSAEGFRTRQAAAGSIASGAGASGGAGIDGYNGSLTGDVSATIGVNCGMSTGRNGVMVKSGDGSIPLDHNPSDGRLTVIDDDVTQTLTQRMGTGGNNVPLLLKIRAGCEGGGKGPLLQTDRSAALTAGNDQTLFEPVVYGICSDGSNAMRSDNPHSGIYEAKTTRTLDANGGSPACNQGGMVVLEGNGTRPSHCGSGYAESDISFTLNATEQHGVAYSVTTGSFMECNTEKTATLVARDYKDPAVVASPAYGLGRDVYNQGQNAKYEPAIDEELQPPLIARGPGAVSYGFDPQRKAESTGFCEDVSAAVVNGSNPGYHNGLVDGYTVRRLTPTECACLQGFPDNWCADLGTEDPAEEEMVFWRGVFETHRKITGTASKPKTDNQIRKWLKDPHTDAAEYRLWGNGVALPCVFFVLAGIAAHHEGKLKGDET